MKRSIIQSFLWLFFVGFSILKSEAQTNATCTAQTLWSWGNNRYGQIGDATDVNKFSPIKITNSADWKQVCAGYDHSVGIRNDGSLWAWGRNDDSRLGDATTIDRYIPLQIGSAKDWKQVSVGYDYTVALKTDGTLWAWGNNIYGQLGDGTNTKRLIPVKIGTATNWKMVEAGAFHNHALKTDGTLWAWGNNLDAELGDGSTVNKNSPVKIGTATDWSQISAGGLQTLALKTDGSLWAWGDNQAGQLGDGTTTTRKSPIKIGTDTNWKQISAGGLQSAALKNDGSLWAWGMNFYGQLGNGTTVDKSSPIKIGTATDWKQVSTGDGYTVALKNNGSLWAWGNNDKGQLGDGTSVNKTSPIRIGTETNWAFINTNSEHSIALKCNTALILDPTKCYRIVNKATNKVLEIKNASLTDSTQIYQWAFATNRPQQLWKTTLLSDGKYSIKSVSSGKVMDILDNTPAVFCVEGTIIQQFPYDGTNSQRWGLTAQTDGSYKILNTTCNKYLRVESASTANGASVGIKNDFGTDAFKWYFQAANCVTGAVLSATNATFGFEARASEGRAKLQWITNTGYKTDYFEVERMNAQGSFDVLGRQNVLESRPLGTEGNNDMKSYSFTDNDPLDGDNFYRINSISQNAPPQYSEVKKVSFSKNDGISIFPNPADEFINVDLRKYEGKTVSLSVYNSVGFLVKNQTIEKVSAAPQQIDMQGFGAGSYLLRVQSEGKREVTRLFNIAK